MSFALRAALVSALAVAVLAFPSLASAGERVVQFRTHEVGSTPPVGCPYTVGVRNLDAVSESYRTSASNGAVVNDSVQQIGTVKACLSITSAGQLQPDGMVPFYAEFTMADGLYVADGKCRVTSNVIPRPGIILGGCALNLTSAPDGVMGGSVSSASLLNTRPAELAQFSTGSYWTIRAWSNE